MHTHTHIHTHTYIYIETHIHIHRSDPKTARINFYISTQSLSIVSFSLQSSLKVSALQLGRSEL